MKKSTWLPISLFVSASFALIGAGGPAAQTQTPARPDGQELAARRRLQKPPKIVSLVKSLRVEKAEIESSGGVDYLLLTVRNDSHKPVACVSFCSMMHELGYSSRTECSRTIVLPGVIYQEDDAVPAYGERTDQFRAVALEPDKPLFVCAATFTDGTQEGDERVREHDKKLYEKIKEMRRNQKGVN